MTDAIAWWQALVLGVVQGLTEFLPVSSSGHLALMQWILRMEAGGVAFAVLLHLGTLVAVGIAYPRRFAELVVGGVRLPVALFRPRPGWTEAEAFAARIVVASIPGGIVGILLKDRIEAAFDSPAAVGAALLVTGALLMTTRGRTPGTRDVGFREAWIVGCAQAVAILPGISRSGTTIATALLLGVRRESAAEFSFMASVPLILGAGALEARHLAGGESGAGPAALAIGFVSAVVLGWVAIRWLVRLVRAGTFHRFAPYCWLVGILALAFATRR